jgi:hypothetical protein
MSELLGKEIERERDIEHLLCYFSPLWERKKELYQ